MNRIKMNVSRTKKGVFVSIVVIFVLLMVSGGSFFTAILGKQTITEEVSYSTKDVKNLAEAKIRSEQYQKNLKDELRYSFSQASYIAAKKIKTWGDDPPEIDEIKQTLENEILNNRRYGLNSQRMIAECYAPNTFKKIKFPENDSVRLNPSQELMIRCPEKYTTAENNFTIEYTVENRNNTFLPIANYSTNLAQEFLDLIPSTASATGTDSLGCQPQITTSEKNNVKSNARTNARTDLKTDTENNLTKAWSQTSSLRPNYIEKTAANLNLPGRSYNKQNEDNPSSGECTYKGTPKSCIPPGNLPSCCNQPGNPTKCRPTLQGENYSVTYEYEPDTIGAQYKLRDKEHQIKIWTGTKTAKKNLIYRFSVTKDIN